MTWIGLDIGSRRIGVAVSDNRGIIAHPLTTLATRNHGDFPLEELRGLLAERGVTGIVVGLPRRLDGSHGPAATAAEAIATWLAEVLAVRVELWDERLTSVQAERLLVEAGVRRKQRKGATDRIAAALILQGFLDHRSMLAGAVTEDIEP